MPPIVRASPIVARARGASASVGIGGMGGVGIGSVGIGGMGIDCVGIGSAAWC